MGERGDIIRTMQRAFNGKQRDYVLFDTHKDAEVVGRVAAKGLVDELSERSHLIVDGVDGRAHRAV
jgi:type IV secretory pathway VirD2 relaxase